MNLVPPGLGAIGLSLGYLSLAFDYGAWSQHSLRRLMVRRLVVPRWGWSRFRPRRFTLL